MVFKIGEKKANASYATNIPVPLLPPPPSPSSSKNYKDASGDASSSSSETDNDDDPLAIFRSKSIKNKTNQQHGKNLIADWDEDETKKLEDVQESVCLIFVYMYLLLSCLCFKFIRGWCYFNILYLQLFLYLSISSKKKFNHHHHHHWIIIYMNQIMMIVHH
jgi:hypothetical protein